jgi:Endoplasmic reticulum vesicle transporter
MKKIEPFIAIKFKKSLLLPEVKGADGDFDRSAHFSLTRINGRSPSGILAKLRGDVHNKDSCRIYGQLEIHKCQGDFHITARGHGYQQFGGEHLDHDSILSIYALSDEKEINFTHIIDEFSFGEYFPNIVNPLDSTFQTADESMFRS